MRRADSGFTLLELLVSVSILAVIAVMSWRGLDSVIRSRDIVTAQTDAINGLEMTFEQLAFDSENAAAPQDTGLPSVWAYPSQAAFVIVRRTPSQQAFAVPQANGSNNSAKQSGGVQLVLYRLAGDRFVRRASPLFNNRSSAQEWIRSLESELNRSDVLSDPQNVALLGNVQGLSLRLWADDAPGATVTEPAWKTVGSQSDEMTRLTTAYNAQIHILSRVVKGLELRLTVARTNNAGLSVNYTKLLLLGT
ncbi:PulJ/GspJ family protein [Ampullimonas aquatilis]|uniref:PulJ/GspJ family protein n=1 Tax=Ampullimonas aquatilis TaxID=1341549 RepID=UPI003C780188